MVRKLREKDFNEMMDLLSTDPIINCYMISDLMNLGFKKSYLSFYGLFIHKKLSSILMIYDAYGMVFSVDNHFSEAFISLIENSPIKSLSGQDQTIKKLHQHFSDFPIKPMTLACLEETKLCVNHPNVRKISSSEELEQLYDLLRDIEEFNVKTQSKEEFIREKINLNEHGNIYAIYEENEMVASASVISETKTHAVINGVATHKNHRKKGYAKALIEQIIYDYVCVRKMGLILYYDNPHAQRIYKKNCFVDINVWTSIDMYEKYKMKSD